MKKIVLLSIILALISFAPVSATMIHYDAVGTCSLWLQNNTFDDVVLSGDFYVNRSNVSNEQYTGKYEITSFSISVGDHDILGSGFLLVGAFDVYLMLDTPNTLDDYVHFDSDDKQAGPYDVDLQSCFSSFYKFPEQQFAINENVSLHNACFDINSVPVPEPSTIILLSIGISTFCVRTFIRK